MSEFNVRGKKTSSFNGSRQKYPKGSITSVLWAWKGGEPQEEAGKASWNEFLHLGSLILQRSPRPSIRLCGVPTVRHSMVLGMPWGGEPGRLLASLELSQRHYESVAPAFY